jgi:hypothetical protein
MTKSKQILLSLLALTLVVITGISLSINTDFLKGDLRPVGSGSTNPTEFTVLSPGSNPSYDNARSEDVVVSVAISELVYNLQDVTCLAKIDETIISADYNLPVFPIGTIELSQVVVDGNIFSGVMPIDNMRGYNKIYINCRGSEMDDEVINYGFTATGSSDLPRIENFHPRTTTESSTLIAINTDREVEACKYSTTNSSINWNTSGLSTLTPSNGTLHTGRIPTTGESTYVAVTCGSDLSSGFEASESEQFLIRKTDPILNVEPIMSIHNPAVLNQQEYTKWSPTPSNNSPIPNMPGNSDFPYTKNFDSIKDVVSIIKDGQTRALYIFNNPGQFMSISWDGQTCATYLLGLKNETINCETGIYDIKVISTIADGRKIEAIESFEIINETITENETTPGLVLLSPDYREASNTLYFKANNQNVEISAITSVGFYNYVTDTLVNAPSNPKTESPYDIVMPLDEVENGRYNFIAKMTLNNGSIIESNIVKYTVTTGITTPTPPPTETAPVVTIESPGNGDIVNPLVQPNGDKITGLVVRTDKGATCFASQSATFKKLIGIPTTTQRVHTADIIVSEGANTWYIKCTDDINAEENSDYTDIVHTGNMSETVSTTFKVLKDTNPPSDSKVSCLLTYTISNTQNEKFDPDTEKMTIKYSSNNTIKSDLGIKVSVMGPILTTTGDISSDTNIILKKETISAADLPYVNSFEWNGQGVDSEILEDGQYLFKIEASDDDASNNLTGKKYDCEQLRPFEVQHTGGTGTDPIMQIGAKKTLVPFGEEQLITFKNNVEAKRVVINLYRTDSSQPVSTAYYYCGPGEKCPETQTKNMSIGTRSIAVPYRYFSDPAKYYFKASLKTKSGKIYKVSSNRFEPESGTILIPQCDFSDINPSDPRFGDIIRVCDLGIMIGSPDPYNPNLRIFNPFQPLNRIEGITISNRLSMCPSFESDPNMIASIFNDMSPYVLNFNAKWMFDEINKGINCLALTGYADGTIRPTQSLSNAEAWKIVLEAIQNSGLGRFNPIYADNRKDPWWSDYEYFLRQNALNIPNPTLEITRAEIASFIIELERRGLVEFIEPYR